MRKIGMINAPLAAVIASMGHTDTLAVADAGLPIPSSTQRIDLALKPGVPGFLDTLNVVLTELAVEKAILAEEIESASPAMLEEIRKALPGIPLEFVPHTEFKRRTGTAKAVVRTGEFTPYSNVILVAGTWGFPKS